MKLTALILAAAASGTAMAQHQGDVLLTVANGRIQTGAIFEDGTVDLDERVFLSRFGEAFPDFTDEPGFDNEPGTFPVGSAVGFRVLAAVREWDGATFDRISEERIEIAFGGLGPVMTPVDDSPVGGFTISVGANGQWHRHLEYTLMTPAGTGVYLLEMSLFSSVPAIAESEPFWIVFGQGVSDEELQAAGAWVAGQQGCAADFNADGFLDFFDYGDFVACFETGACGEGTADFNGDGFVDFFDYGDYVAAFEAGCV